MGIPLIYGKDQSEQLITVAATHARDIHDLCSDVAAIIFPSSLSGPTEATIHAVTATLLQLVADLESKLAPDFAAKPPRTWTMLSRSGFLREPDLIDFALARVAESRLETMTIAANEAMPTSLLDHADANIAEAAQILLAAGSLHNHAAGYSYLMLPPELLHKICWRVVAALEIINGARQSDVIVSARLIIAHYSEGNRAQAAAAKIAHFCSGDERRLLLQPATAGVKLHVAALATALDLDADHVFQLIDGGSCAPYAIMLAALGVGKSDAIEAICLFRADRLTEREAGVFDADYDALDTETALTEIRNWAAARTAYLAFGRP